MSNVDMWMTTTQSKTVQFLFTLLFLVTMALIMQNEPQQDSNFSRNFSFP